jgi:hypothetical protein
MIGTFGLLPGMGAAWGVAASNASMLTSIIVVIVLGGGGTIIGALVSAAMARFNRMKLKHRAENGGLVLWARPSTSELEAAALQVLRKHNALNIHARAA